MTKTPSNLLLAPEIGLPEVFDADEAGFRVRVGASLAESLPEPDLFGIWRELEEDGGRPASVAVPASPDLALPGTHAQMHSKKLDHRIGKS